MRTAALGVLALVIAACGDAGEGVEAQFVSARAATIEPGDVLAEAADPVLTVTGAEGEDLAVLDIDTIESLGTVRATVYEEWFERDVDFEGVWLEDLVAAAGVDSSDIEVHALDDFVAAVDLDEVVEHDVLLATKADGNDIAVEDGGPLRLVFLDPDGLGSDKQLWIWNIDAITAR